MISMKTEIQKKKRRVTESVNIWVIEKNSLDKAIRMSCGI